MSGVERMLTEPISKRLWPGLAGAQHDHSTAWGPDMAGDGSRITAYRAQAGSRDRDGGRRARRGLGVSRRGDGQPE